MEKLTAAELARLLGVSRGTIFSLRRRYPFRAPETFNDVEKWRTFILANVTNSDLICRLCR
jgi:hypothetical protein